MPHCAEFIQGVTIKADNSAPVFRCVETMSVLLFWQSYTVILLKALSFTMQLKSKNTQKKRKGSESRCILGGILHGEKRCLSSKRRGGKSNILHLKPLQLPFIIDLLVFFINGTSE